MKAWVLVGHGAAKNAFELRDMKEPVPGEGEVAIRSEAFGLNYADVMARQGLYQDCPPLPAVIGYEVVGRISALGPGVEEFSIGQRVAALTRFGGYGQTAVTSAMGVVAIPEDMPVGTAAALATQYGTAYYCAEEMARLFPGDHVLVQAAAGGVGTALVQLAKRRGCIVYGTAGTDTKLEYLRSLGVDFPINYRNSDFEQVVRAQIGTRGLDVVFDSIGGQSVRKGMRLLGSGGRIVCYGAAALSGGKNPIKMLGFAAGFGLLSPIPLLQQSQGIIGVNMLRIADNRPLTLRRVLREVTDLVLDGTLSPKTGEEFAEHELPLAHEKLASRGTTGKLVVHWK
jgi:NADPH:quinone reductase-like Zn-dependent oxidoreductase